MRTRRFIQVIGVVGAVGITAAATYGALTVLGVELGGSSEAQVEPSHPGGLLLIQERDQLAICVEWLPPGFSPDSTSPQLASPAPEQLAAQAAVEAALPALAQHRVWSKWDLSNPPPTVSGDCPSGPAAYDAEGGSVPGLPPSFFNVAGRLITTASPYRVHVFVVAPDEIDRLGGRNWRYTVEETICEDHICSEVTTGLYMSADEMTNQDFVVARLARGIGLE